MDDLIKLNYTNNILIKLDVQGFEKNVLMGSRKNLKKIKYILIELSSSEIYKNQHTEKNIINFLKKKNFKIIKKINKNYISKNIYQSDFLFVNKSIK